MCLTDESKKVTHPAYDLSNLLNRHSAHTGSDNVCKLIREKWDTICKLAHAIHDEEMSKQKKLDRAIATVTELDLGGIKNVISGNATPEVFRDFELVAKAVLKQT